MEGYSDTIIAHNRVPAICDWVIATRGRRALLLGTGRTTVLRKVA